MNKDVLSCVAQFLPSSQNSNLIGLLAGVNSDFNDAFQEEAYEIGEDRRYAALRSYISDDLELNHGFEADPGSADESLAPMQMFVLGEEANVAVYLFRGPGSTVVFTSEAVNWDNLPFDSKEAWDKFSPWVSLPALVDLSTLHVA